MSPPFLASLRLLRALTLAVYLLASGGGVAVLAYPPRTYVGSDYAVTIAWGAVLAVGGLIAAAGVVSRRYFLEWGACYVLAAGLTLYSWLSWEAAADSLGSVPRAFLITAGVTAALARGTAIAIDDWRARRAAIATQREAGTGEVG